MRIILTAAAVLVLALVFMSLPVLSPSRRRRLAPFEAVPIAHRGLFDNGSQAPENTIPAIRMAAEAGYGIEIDVRLSKDGRLVVAHDPNLKRIAGVNKEIKSMAANELANTSVFGSRCGVPLFSEVMKAAGKAPMIVEIKAESRAAELSTCRAAAAQLAEYAGPCCVQAFSPTALLWFRLHRPNMLRGQLSMDFFAARRAKKKTSYGFVVKFLLTNLLLNFVSKPDYVAYDFRDRRALALRLQKKLYKTVLAAWTLKNEAQLAEAAKTFNILIFDGFNNALNKTGSVS